MHAVVDYWCLAIANGNYFVYSEGWEQLSLFDYYKNKSEAVKTKQDEIEQGMKEKSPTPEPVTIVPPPPDKLDRDFPNRRYRLVGKIFFFVFTCSTC